jgi:hypothetical protein
MHDTAFDMFVRRTANRRDRRSFLGGLSAALPALVGLPLAAAGKNKHKHKHKHKHKKRKKKKKEISCNKELECRQAVLPGCDLAPQIPNCENRVKQCCDKACKSEDDAVDCIADIGF